MPSEVITATVTITYGGLKATQYFSKWTLESEMVLRRDIARFRIPLPKRSNIKLVRFGCLQSSDPGWIEEQNALKKELFVTGLSLRMFKGSPNQPSVKRANPNADTHYPISSAGTSSCPVHAFSSPLAHANKRQKLDHSGLDYVTRNPPNNHVAAPAVHRSPPVPTRPPHPPNIPTPLMVTSTFAQPVPIPPIMTAAMEAQITAMLSNPAPSPTVVRNVRNFILTHFSSHPERLVYCTRLETSHLIFSNTSVTNNSVLRTYAQACRLIEEQGDFTQVSRATLGDGETALLLGTKAVNPLASAPPTSNTVPQKAELSAPPVSAPPTTNIARHQIATQSNPNALSTSHTPTVPTSIGHSQVSTAPVASNTVGQNNTVLGSANHAGHPQVLSASASPTSSVASQDAAVKSPSYKAQPIDDVAPLATALPPRHTKMGNGEVPHVPLQINTSRIASPTERQPTSSSRITPAAQQQCISATTTSPTVTVAYAPDPRAPATTSVSPLEKQYEKESQEVPQPMEDATVAAHEPVQSALTEQTAIPPVKPLDNDHDSGSSNMSVSSPPAEAERTMVSVPAAQRTNSQTLRVSQSPAAAQSPPINSSPEEPSMTSSATTDSERLSRVEMLQNALVFIQDRGSAVVSELQQIGVTPNIDVRFAVVADRDRVAALEEQVKKIQLELDEERKQVQEQRRMLEEDAKLIEEGQKLVEAAHSRTEEEQKIAAEERRRRLEAENALADVERECRAPFVVPALLDAFMSVSKLTTQVLKTRGE